MTWQYMATVIKKRLAVPCKSLILLVVPMGIEPMLQE
jgi:hypothetical protein